MKSLLPFTILVLFTLGCSGAGTVTDGDRMVLDQTHKAGIVAGDALGAGKVEVAKAAIADVKTNMAQQLAVHGGPKAPVAYTPEASKAARDQSDKEHGSGWGWTDILLGVLGVAATGAATWFGGPVLGNMVSNLTGKWTKLGQATVQGVTEVRQVADMNDGKLDVQEVLRILMNKQDELGVQAFAAKLAKENEAELAILHNNDLPKEIAGE